VVLKKKFTEILALLTGPITDPHQGEKKSLLAENS
jgi:hypothetical protein